MKINWVKFLSKIIVTWILVMIHVFILYSCAWNSYLYLFFVKNLSQQLSGIISLCIAIFIHLFVIYNSKIKKFIGD